MRHWDAFAAGRPLLAPLLGALILALPFLGFAALMRETVLAQLERGHNSERLQATTIAASLVATEVEAMGDGVELVAQRALLRQALAARSVPDLERHLADLRIALSRLNSAAVFGLDGTMIARDPSDEIVGQSFADRDYFRGAITSAGTYVSDPFESRAQPPQSLVAIAIAVRDAAGPYGVLQVTMTTASLLPVLDPVAGVEGRHFVVVDHRGSVVAGTRGERALVPSGLPFVERPFAGASGAARAAVEGRDRLLAYAPVRGTPWALYAVDDPELALRGERALETTMTAAAVMTLLVLGAAGAVAGASAAYRQRSLGLARSALETQRTANDQLAALTRQKDEFVSTASHEFRTPLTGILGFSEMIRDEELTTQEIREYAADIHADARRLSRLIEDMLDLDRMASGQMRIVPAPMDLAVVIREVVEKTQAGAPDHRIRTDLVELPSLSADRDRMTQVITNLVSNAVKYSPAGGDVVIRAEPRDGAVHVSVSDHGIGIPQASLDSVFERFARVDSKETRAIRGTGLGLAIVRQIVELHGGRVWVDSEVGKGSTFHVTMPVEG